MVVPGLLHKKLGIFNNKSSKPGKQYLHVFTRPADGKLLVPGLKVINIAKGYELADKQLLNRNHYLHTQSRRMYNHHKCAANIRVII